MNKRYFILTYVQADHEDNYLHCPTAYVRCLACNNKNHDVPMTKDNFVCKPATGTSPAHLLTAGELKDHEATKNHQKKMWYFEPENARDKEPTTMRYKCKI